MIKIWFFYFVQRNDKKKTIRIRRRATGETPQAGRRRMSTAREDRILVRQSLQNSSLYDEDFKSQVW